MSDYFGQTEEDEEEVELPGDEVPAPLPPPPSNVPTTTELAPALAPVTDAPPTSPTTTQARQGEVLGIAVGIGFLAFAWWLSRELSDE